VRLPFRPFFFLCLLALIPVMASAAEVDNLRLGVHPGSVRMVLDVRDVSSFRAFMMQNPYRLAVDLPSFDWRVPPVAKPRGTDVTGVRQGPLTPSISRIVIDLDHPALIDSASIIPSANGEGKRLVIDFRTVSTPEFVSGKGKVFGSLQDAISPSSTVAFDAPAPQPVPVWHKNAPAASADTSGQDSQDSRALFPARSDHDDGDEAATTPAARTTQAVAQTKAAIATLPSHKSDDQTPALAPGEKPLIVIDPGHGGIDPGSLGVNGLFEKNVTIGMARELKKELEATGRYRVLMTRETDVFIPLGQRVAFAREHHANLFVSLHADSINRPDIQGASIYTLSDTASDAETEKLAARENRSDMIGGLNVDSKDDQVASILVDLVTRDNMNRSKFFSNVVTSHLRADGVDLLEHTERSAGFAVLKAPDIPSVLIELGFMTSARESQLLMSDDYRRKVSSALVAGIDSYFTQLRPAGKT
jgi:N-acetylmuramoyl-L-alanine amidase